MRLNKWLYRHMLSGYYRIKGMGVFALIPLLVLYILIPITNYAVFQYFQDMEMLRYNIVSICQYLVPICSIWHIIFILYHFVEESGNEVLYISFKDKLADLILPYILYAVLLLPLFFVYTRMFPELWFFYMKLCAINLAYMAFVYCATFMLNSISVSVIGIIIYTICEMIIHRNQNEGYDYFEEGQNFIGFIQSNILPYVVIAIVLFILGKLMNKYLLKYK